MKILFVCRGNIGRSQMAKALFNASCREGDVAFACGTRVGEFENQMIRDVRTDSVEDDIRSMHEVGLDIAEAVRKNITPEMVMDADQVVVMAEKDTWPEYLFDNQKVIYWEVENPKGQTYEKTCEIRNIIKKLVGELIQII